MPSLWTGRQHVILALEQTGDGLLLCGAGRLVVRIHGSTAESLLPAGREPQAAPRFHDIAVLDTGDIVLVSWHELWRLADERLLPLEVPQDVHASAGVISAVEDRLLVGDEAVYSAPSVGAPSQIWRAPAPETGVVDFVRPRCRPPFAVWSHGDVVELSTPARLIGNILGTRSHG